MPNRYRPVILLVLDGWGIANTIQGNPIREATLPTFEKLNRYYPMTALQASGVAVGLPWNTEGNSEVGHMTMGAGKVIYQNFPRITLSMQDGTFFKNSAFLQAIEHVKAKQSTMHLMGLLGEGAVHSYKDHLHALLKLCKDEGVSRLSLHIFTDGRDGAPTAGLSLVRELEGRLKMLEIGEIVSLCGRHFAMDRNNNWDRIQKAYAAMTAGEGHAVTDFHKYIEGCYAKNQTDEFIEPAYKTGKSGQPVSLIQDGDAVIFFNFREDRAREITKAFVLPDFKEFPREKKLDVIFTTITEYENGLPATVAFPPETIQHTLGEILAEHHLKQLRLAETEKYAHVTYFFNGGQETAFPGEDRLLIPSPYTTHFDEVPEMGTPKITEKVIELLNTKQYDFILINFANPDMVGHTGNEEATIQAVESVDKALSLLIPKILEAGGALLITADHGNAEELKKAATGEIDTEHSINPVPFWLVTPDNHREKTAEKMVEEQNTVQGLLSDIAPTILDLFGLSKPAEMHGDSLLPLLEKK